MSTIREQLYAVTTPDHFRYAEDFEEWIKTHPQLPPTPERIELNRRRLAAIVRYVSHKAPL